MKKLLIILSIASLLVVSAKPLGAVISKASDDGTYVTFNVELQTKKAIRQAYSTWVVAICYDAEGIPVSREDHGVDDYSNGPTSGVVGPFQRQSNHCAAYVWVFPSSHDPISNILEF